MKRRDVVVVCLLVASGLALGGIIYGVFALQSIPAKLGYDAVHKYRVGNSQVTIETRSLSLKQGDDGDAEVLVSAGGRSTTLASRFSDDMFTYVRPAYVSWQNVDEHAGRDLIIWRPVYSSGPLSASEYISSGDGKLHELKPPLERRLPWNF